MNDQSFVVVNIHSPPTALLQLCFPKSTFPTSFFLDRMNLQLSFTKKNVLPSKEWGRIELCVLIRNISTMAATIV